jgi:hypothetical protein
MTEQTGMTAQVRLAMVPAQQGAVGLAISAWVASRSTSNTVQKSCGSVNHHGIGGSGGGGSPAAVRPGTGV